MCPVRIPFTSQSEYSESKEKIYLEVKKRLFMKGKPMLWNAFTDVYIDISTIFPSKINH